MNDLLDALPVTGDLRPGGRFRTEGNADGQILACEAPVRLVVTWGARTVRAWEAVLRESVLRESGLATEEQVAAAVEVSLQQFAVRPGAQS